MNFHWESHLPPATGQETVFKYKERGSLGLFVLLLGLTVGAFVGAWTKGFETMIGASWAGWGWVLAGIFGILALLVLGYYGMKSRQGNPWLLRTRFDGVYLKIRSYETDAVPENRPGVVQISYCEIDWVRKTRQRVASPAAGPEPRRRSFSTVLDIGLRSRHAARLERALEEERRWSRSPEARALGIRPHFPVRWVEPDLVQVEWKGIHPRIEKALDALKPRVAVRPELKLESGPGEGDGRPVSDGWITDLAERGQVTEAASLAREKYGYSLSESKKFVEELVRH